MSLAHPLTGSGLASEYTPGGKIESELPGVPAHNSLPQPHDGGGAVPIPIQGHFSVNSAAGSFLTLKPSDSPPWIKELWANTMLPNQLMSE